MEQCIKCGTNHNQVDDFVQWTCKACSTVNFNDKIKVIVKEVEEEEIIDREVSGYKTFYNDGEA